LLELDHVFCIVSDPAQAARRLEDDGWVLDAGQAHRGQGTRNRRLAWPEQFFELLWVTDAAEARANPLRLDRRADWATTGASPVGLAFRGQIDPAHGDEFWLYDALGLRIWVHRDNERYPQRPLVLVLGLVIRR
jgi:Glyoxalase-like domain